MFIVSVGSYQVKLSLLTILPLAMTKTSFFHHVLDKTVKRHIHKKQACMYSCLSSSSSSYILFPKFWRKAFLIPIATF